ncbi:hypothetical protein KL936_004753 [Ogataea polymorpha]|nr:hypothetical protein KL936_004753 [Ogataea polymorpha]
MPFGRACKTAILPSDAGLVISRQGKHANELHSAVNWLKLQAELWSILRANRHLFKTVDVRTGFPFSHLCLADAALEIDSILFPEALFYLAERSGTLDPRDFAASVCLDASGM